MKIVGSAWMRLLASGVFLTAMVGCEQNTVETTETDSGADTGVDTDTGETVDTTPDSIEIDSGDTNTELTCTRTQDCTDQLGTGFICENGVCVEQVLPDPCAADGQECTDPANQETDEFTCVQETTDGPAFCRQLCNADTADDTGSEDCPLNTYCFDVGAVNTVGLTGACIPGDCATNIFDETACGGAGTCLPVGHGASFCIGAGTAIEGEACGLDASDTPPDTDVCAPGLLCSNNVCIAPCDRTNGNADCTDGLTCLAAFDFTPRNRPGLCGTACDAFSVGQCSTGETCQPFLGRAGVNIWACVASTGDTVFGPDEICDTTAGACTEGYLCVGVETDAGGNSINRCTQLCDVEAELAGETPCGSAGAGTALIDSVDFGAASNFLSFPAGSYDVQVRDVASGSLVTDLTVAVAAGEVHSELATLDATGAFTRFTYVDLRAGEVLPANGVRLIHAAASAPDVDVYVASELATVASGDATGYIDVAAGGYNFWQDTNFSGYPVTAGGANDVFVFDGNTTILTYNSADAVTGALLRVVHGSALAGNVDVYADCAGGFAGCTATELVASGFAFGDNTDYLALTAGEHTFFVAAAGADPTTDSALLTVGPVTLAEGGRYTAVANDLGGPNVALLTDAAAPTAGSAAFRVHNYSSAEVTTALESTTPVAPGVAFGDAVEGDTSAYIALPAGNYAAVLRGAGAASSAAPAFVAPFALSGLATAVVTDNGSALTAILLSDAVVAPAAGQGSVRVVHAAGGVGAVSINLPGTVDSICAPSAVAGIGFCNESCEPFPRNPGSNYGCSTDGDGCFPIVLTDAEPTEPRGVCDTNDGTIAPFEACTNGGTIGECADFAVCLDFTDDGAENPNCNPLCPPLDQTDGCGPGATCSAIFPLTGNLNFGLCTQEFTAGSVGSRCVDEFLPCEDSGTFCIDTGAGPTCVLVCREGFNDCANDPGTACNNPGFDPTLVPAFMGLCL